MTAAVRMDRRSTAVAHSPADADRDSVDQYLREVGRFSLLTAEDEAALGVRARAGDECAIGELVSRNLRFVISVAKKYQNRGLPLNDLIGEGNVGLLTAARKFDPEQGVRFISYAVWWIRQSILSAVARQSGIVRVPTTRVAENARINRAADVLRQKLLREPSFREIAEATGATIDAVRAAGGRGSHDVSLDSPVNGDSEQSLLERYSADEDAEGEDDGSTSQLCDRLAQALRFLPERNARILRLHFGLDGGREHTLEEIGAILGVTRERVRQLRDRSLRRLREGESARVLGEFADTPAPVAQFGGRESPERRCGRPRQAARRPPDRRRRASAAL